MGFHYHNNTSRGASELSCLKLDVVECVKDEFKKIIDINIHKSTLYYINTLNHCHGLLEGTTFISNTSQTVLGFGTQLQIFVVNHAVSF